MDAFDYGEYARLAADPRTNEALAVLDTVAKKLRVKYSLIGGMAAYMHIKNPPEDFPDLDFVVHADALEAKEFVEALTVTDKRFRLRFMDMIDDDAAMFSTLIFDKDIQFDIFTSYDEQEPRKTDRMGGVDVSPVEPLIVEKIIRGRREDILMAVDLLAYTDYDKNLLSRIGAEYRITGALNTAAYWARRLAVGKLTREGLAAVVKRLTTA